VNVLELRALVSTTLLLLFLILLVSGTILYFELADDEEPFLLLDKHGWEDVHTYAGYLMALFVAVHLYLNWNMYKNELRTLQK